MIVPFNINEIHLILGRVLQKYSLIVIEEQKEEKISDKIDDTVMRQNSPNPPVNQPFAYPENPPFREILKVDENLEKKLIPQDHDMLDELRSVCIRIPLLQVIKYIPIYVKRIKELSIEK